MTTTETRVPSPEMEVAAEAPSVNLPSAVEASRPPAGPMLPPTTGFGKVVGAIAAVMAELTPVEKGGKNQFHNYKYARMQDILQTLTPLMGKHGLAVFQYETDRQMFDDNKVLAIRYNFIVAHSSGEAWVHPVPQTGMSPCRTSDKTGNKFDDKSFAKAHTSARKYFLLSLFQIPTEDEADPDNEKRQLGSAPVPSPDGHVVPHLIEPTQRDSFDAWADRYLAAARTSKTLAEVDAWDAANDDPLSQMDANEKGRPVYGRIVREIEVIRAKLQPVAQAEKAISEALASAPVVPPAEDKQAAERPKNIPNAEMDPDGFLTWAMARIDSFNDDGELMADFEQVIMANADGLFKPDVDSIKAHYEKRLAKIGG